MNCSPQCEVSESLSMFPISNLFGAWRKPGVRLHHAHNVVTAAAAAGLA
jgi:hypothetical protein